MSLVPRREWIFPFLIALFFIAAGSVPYIYAYAIAPSGAEFMGLIGRDTLGGNSYLAFSRQVAEGHTALTNLYSADAPANAYFSPEWWAMGLAGRWTGLSLIAVFHGGRVLTVFAFVLAVYYLCAVVLPVAQRRAALLLICFGAGLGWIVFGANALVGTHLPLSLDAQGVTPFAYLMNKPHFMRAGAFAALQYAWFIRGEQTGERRYFLFAGLAAAGHSIIRPYHIPEATLFLFLYWVFRTWQTPARTRVLAGQAIACFLGHSPLILWHAYVYVDNALRLGAFVSWNPMYLGQQILWLGVPFVALLGYGAVAFYRNPQSLPAMPVLGLWMLSAFLLFQWHPYFPWGVESYFAWVLAPPVLFVQYVWPWLGRLWATRPDATTWRRSAVALLIALVVPCNVLAYGKFFRDLPDPDPLWQYYLADDVIAATTWMKSNLQESNVVLASQDTSQFIPRLVSVRVLTGQDVLAPRYREKNSFLLRFFQSPGDDGYKRWMCRHLRVTHVLIGPWEQEIAYQDYGVHPWLVPVFEEGEVTVYRVDLP